MHSTSYSRTRHGPATCQEFLAFLRKNCPKSRDFRILAGKWSKAFGVCRMTLYRWVRKLARAGYLEIESGGNQTIAKWLGLPDRRFWAVKPWSRSKKVKKNPPSRFTAPKADPCNTRKKRWLTWALDRRSFPERSVSGTGFEPFTGLPDTASPPKEKKDRPDRRDLASRKLSNVNHGGHAMSLLSGSKREEMRSILADSKSYDLLYPNDPVCRIMVALRDYMIANPEKVRGFNFTVPNSKWSGPLIRDIHQCRKGGERHDIWHVCHQLLSAYKPEEVVEEIWDRIANSFLFYPRKDGQPVNQRSIRWFISYPKEKRGAAYVENLKLMPNLRQILTTDEWQFSGPNDRVDAETRLSRHTRTKAEKPTMSKQEFDDFLKGDKS